MANVKVTLGGETRRFIVSTELSYDDLVKKVSNLFPSLRDSSLKLELTYRDEDNDLVTLSSDEEVVAALSTITAGKTWRLQARQIRPATAKTPFNTLLFPLLSTGHLSSTSALHRLLDPFSLDSHDTLLSEGLSLFEKLRLAEEKASAEHKASQQKKQSAQQKNADSSSKSKEQQHQAKPAEKTTQTPSPASARSPPPPSFRVSWSPTVAGCPFWSSGLLGPFGYQIHCSWSSQDNQETKPKAHSGKEPETDGKQTEPAKETTEQPTSDQPLEEPTSDQPLEEPTSDQPREEPTSDQPLEEPQEKEEESQPREATPTIAESTSA